MLWAINGLIFVRNEVINETIQSKRFDLLKKSKCGEPYLPQFYRAFHFWLSPKNLSPANPHCVEDIFFRVSFCRCDGTENTQLTKVNCSGGTMYEHESCVIAVVSLLVISHYSEEQKRNYVDFEKYLNSHFNHNRNEPKDADERRHYTERVQRTRCTGQHGTANDRKNSFIIIIFSFIVHRQRLFVYVFLVSVR